MIPQFKVRMSPNAKHRVAEVLDSGFIGQGPKVEEFEDLLWRELNSEIRPITVNSCTSAIDLALELIGVLPGDEVISTPQTCFASQVGAIHREVTIRWADIHPITGCIDPISVGRLITNKTKAIIAVNWAGKLCDFKKLKKYNIPVIEDAAHTWDISKDNSSGYDWKFYDRGDYICYSLQAIKFLTTGDGGILITPPEKQEEARILRWYGLDRNKGQSFRCTQNIIHAGFKYHMNDIAAAIGIENLPYAKDSVITHKKNSKLLYENISNNDVIIPKYDHDCSYWIFPIHILNSRKQEFIDYMTTNRITVSPVHYRNDNYDCTLKFKEGELDGVTKFTDTQICIPNGWWLTNENLEYIINTINNF